MFLDISTGGIYRYPFTKTSFTEGALGRGSSLLPSGVRPCKEEMTFYADNDMATGQTKIKRYDNAPA